MNKCDFCKKNYTENYLKIKNLIKNKIFICENCKKELYKKLSKEIVPASILAPFSPKRIKN